MTDTILILGATGRMGRNAAQAFRSAGWTVRSFDRNRDTLAEAARGADVVFHGWNPPYSQWAAQVPALTRQVIAAAKVSGATVLIPGNVYVYGAGSAPLLTPETPHAATNGLGRVRIAMEAAYRDAGVRTIVLRAGDFLDTAASGNWFDHVIAAKAHQGVLRYPGRADIPHAWAYLPDLARSFVLLADRRASLPVFSDFTFPGYTLSGNEMAEACAEALWRPVAVRQMSWLPIHLSRPVWREAKHLLEMRYLWNMPHTLSATALRKTLGEVPETPLITAMTAALAPQALTTQERPKAAMA